ATFAPEWVTSPTVLVTRLSRPGYASHRGDDHRPHQLSSSLNDVRRAYVRQTTDRGSSRVKGLACREVVLCADAPPNSQPRQRRRRRDCSVQPAINCWFIARQFSTACNRPNGGIISIARRVGRSSTDTGCARYGG